MVALRGVARLQELDGRLSLVVDASHAAAVLSSWKKVKALSLVVMLAVAAVLVSAKVVVALSLVTMAALSAMKLSWN